MVSVSPEFNPLDDAFPGNATKILDRMRLASPVWSETRQGQRIHHVFTYDMAKTVLDNHKTWSSEIDLFADTLLADAAILVQTDPPLHTELRRVLAPWMLQRSRDIESSMRAHLTDQCSSIRNGLFSAHEFSDHIQNIVFAEFFGVSEQTISSIHSWASDFGKSVGAEFLEFSGPRIDQQVLEVRAHHIRLDTILDGALDQGSMAISSLYSTLEAAQLGHLKRSIFKTLVFGLAHTLSSQIKNILFVWADQKILEKCRFMQSENVSVLADELVRVMPVFRGSHRVAKQDTTSLGVEVVAGDFCVVWNTSANHDIDVFPTGSAVSLVEGAVRHLGFGTGIHRCIGIGIARMILEEIVDQLRAAEVSMNIASADVVSDPWADTFDKLTLDVRRGD